MSATTFIHQYKEFSDVRLEVACKVGSLSAATFESTINYIKEKRNYWKIISYLIGYITKRRTNNFDLYANLVKEILKDPIFAEHKSYLIHQLSIFIIRRLLINETVDLEYLKNELYVNQSTAIIDLLGIESEYPEYASCVFNEEWILNGVDPESISAIIQRDDASEMNAAIANAEGNSNMTIPLPFLLFKYLELPMENIVSEPKPIEMAAFFGSVQCFRSLLAQNVHIDQTIGYWAIIGGSSEIIRLILQQSELHIDVRFLAETAVSQCYMNIVQWINEVENSFPMNQFDFIADLDLIENNPILSKKIDSEIVNKEEDPLVDTGLFSPRTRLYFAILHNIKNPKRLFDNCLTDDGCFIGTEAAIEAAKVLIQNGYNKNNVAALRPNDPDFFDWSMTVSNPAYIESDVALTRVWAHMDKQRRYHLEPPFFSFRRAARKRLDFCTLLIEGDTETAISNVSRVGEWTDKYLLVAPPEVVEPFIASTTVKVIDSALMLKDVPRFIDRINEITSFASALPLKKRGADIGRLLFEVPHKWRDFTVLYLHGNPAQFYDFDVIKLCATDPPE